LKIDGEIKTLVDIPTETIEQLIRETPLDDSLDINYLRALLKELSRRPETEPVDVNAAWKWFQQILREEGLSDGADAKPDAEPQVQAKTTPRTSRFRPREFLRRTAAAAMFAVILLIANAAVASAFHMNILRTVISFTDELLTRTIAPSEYTPDVPYIPSGAAVPGKSILQTALDEMGVTQAQAPEWLPEGFEFNLLESSDTRTGETVSALYKNGEKMIALTFTLYSQIPEGLAVSHQKSEGEPLEYGHGGNIHYIFKNLDKTAATWLDGTCDCYIQGDISVDEMKLIINSMYKEN
jgi:hypothetical protein